MHQVEDWAEVHRLREREGRSVASIARQLAMSRNTVARLLALSEPPRYVRPAKGSLLDPSVAAIAAMLDSDPRVRATVVLQYIRADGYRGGVTILKDHLQAVRPAFLAARAFQRTTYRPGEIGGIDASAVSRGACTPRPHPGIGHDAQDREGSHTWRRSLPHRRRL